MSPLQKQARALADAGIKVFPCQENGKLPATAHGWKDATCDLGQVEAWWAENPNYNIAICPEDQGWGVVDIDPGGAEGWAALLATEGDIPLTYIVATPRDGQHIYFVGSLPASVSKLAPHVDTRGRGSYVLVPPSTVNGKPYRVQYDRDIAPCPSWIGARLANRDQQVRRDAAAPLDTPDAIARARNYLRSLVERESVAVSGSGGNDRTYKLFTELRDYGLVCDTALGLVLEDDGWNAHCQPPWDASEIVAIAEHAYHYGQNDPGAWATQPLAESFRGAMKGQQPKPSRFKPMTLAEARALPAPRWLVENLIPRGAHVVLHGEPSSFKSFYALDIALRQATKGEGLVFYVAMEGKHGIAHARTRAWEHHHSIPADKVLVSPDVSRFYLMEGPFVALPSEIEEFTQQIGDCADGRVIDLIVVDTYDRTMGGLDQNNARDVSFYTRMANGLIESFGCTVLTIHHDARGTGRERGSTALPAAAETMLHIVREEDVIEVHVSKQKDAEELQKPLLFRKQSVAGSLVLDPLSEEAARDLRDEQNPYSHRNVGRLLSELRSYTYATGTDAGTLAGLLKRNHAMEEAVETIARTLEKLSKTRLKAYCDRQKNELRFFCLKENEP